jgi:hypothetical protein
MKEVTLAFGPMNHLVGTLLTTKSTADLPTIVFVNAGFVSRVGPNRMTVRLARLLGEHGFPSIRFDFSGIGDSARIKSEKAGLDLAVTEIQMAMDITEQYMGSKRFILFGLCSGTDPCIKTASIDARVAGTILLDPFSYANIRARLLINCRKLKEHVANGTFFAKFRQITRRLKRPRESPSSPAGGDIWDQLRPKPTREEFAKSLVQALRKGRTMLIVYTSFASEHHNYPGQLKHVHRELRPFHKIDVALLPEADHTYPAIFMQEQLAVTLLQHLRLHYARLPSV